ncbi:MAG: hypothetical protein H6732_12720 [Alphaproteobacteria bacterium]|nr:hypothetical protein [Alphaproteobacteria bacterium]
MRRLLVQIACGGLLCSKLAHAWEVDQLTGRADPVPDITAAADARILALLDEAVADVDARLGCGAPVDRALRAVVRRFHRLAAVDARVKGRGALRALGYGAVAAWLETDPALPRRSFGDRGDVFEGIPFGVAPVLSAAGVCSVVRLADVEVGVDKVDHFLEDGFQYLRRSRGGERPDRAVRWGTYTENTYLGWATSSGFSRGDLRANWQGLQFYLTLLDPDRSPVTHDEDGCLARTGSFSWRDWVDPYWDELRYPTTYTPRVRRWLAARLDEAGDAVCEDWDDWGVDVVGAATDDAEAPWVGSRAREEVDAFELVRRCGWPAGRVSPETVAR